MQWSLLFSSNVCGGSYIQMQTWMVWFSLAQAFRRTELQSVWLNFSIYIGIRADRKENMLEKPSSYGGRETGHLKKKNKKNVNLPLTTLCKIFGYLRKILSPWHAMNVYFYVPYPLRVGANMVLHKSSSFRAPSNASPFIILPVYILLSERSLDTLLSVFFLPWVWKGFQTLLPYYVSQKFHRCDFRSDFLEKFLIAHIIHPCYSQHISLEPHFCWLKNPRLMWGNCSAFTTLKKDWYYVTIQIGDRKENNWIWLRETTIQFLNAHIAD